MGISSIKQRIKEVETFKEQNKIARQALANELENDTEYLKACEEVKAAAEKRKRIREAIWAKQETQKIMSDIKDNKEELNTLEEILSAELTDYYNEKGTDEIEDADGDPRRFKIVARVLPKKAKYEDRDNDGKYMAKVEPFDKEELDEDEAVEDDEVEEPTAKDE